MTRLTVLLPLCVAIACGGPDPDAETTAEGQATYEDAETEADDTARQPASPEPGTTMDVSLEVTGTGDFDVGDTNCTLDGNSFEALYEGEGEVSSDGAYLASFAAADASFATPSDCGIPDIDVGLVTGVDVVARIENTSQQCTSYCEAKARSWAEAECEGDADQATCRAEAEASYQGSCETACEDSQTTAIVARTSLGASALSSLAVGQLSGAALGQLDVDLTFDRIEDADGNKVEEAP